MDKLLAKKVLLGAIAVIMVIGFIGEVVTFSSLIPFIIYGILAYIGFDGEEKVRVPILVLALVMGFINIYWSPVDVVFWAIIFFLYLKK